MARKEERYELNVFKLSKVTCKIEKEEKLEKWKTFRGFVLRGLHRRELGTRRRRRRRRRRRGFLARKEERRGKGKKTVRVRKNNEGRNYSIKKNGGCNIRGTGVAKLLTSITTIIIIIITKL